LLTFHNNDSSEGFSLIELIFAMIVLALVATFAFPAYQDSVNRGKSSKAIGDISEISSKIDRYRYNSDDNFPPNLAEINSALIDPWGAPYIYLNMAGANRGDMRKNKNLVPINTDYDLYSKGPDGNSTPALTAKKSHDDIVRANNGAFVGIAESY
jgi:general secretion pathway protein G